MGWAVLYIAFGLVALWLLGEVLLQHKARLRWRLVAFTGFLGVVAGVVVSSVIVIGVGAAAFAVGQTYVTLSFRRGFTAGWALKTAGRMPGRRPARPAAEPTLEVSGVEPGAAPEQPPLPTYQPEPLPDDTGGYAAYRDPVPEPEAPAQPQPGYAPYAAAETTGYPGYDDGYGGYPSAVDGTVEHGVPGQAPAGAGLGGTADAGAWPAADHASGPDGGAGYAGVSDYPVGAGYGYGYGMDAAAPASYADADPYGAGQQPYPAYDQQQPYDPYGQYAPAAEDHYAAPDLYAAPPAAQAAPHDPYQAAQPYPLGPEDTPPGGVWVPQQRDGDAYPAPPQQPPYPYQEEQGHGGGYEQYRY